MKTENSIVLTDIKTHLPTWHKTKPPNFGNSFFKVYTGMKGPLFQILAILRFAGHNDLENDTTEVP